MKCMGGGDPVAIEKKYEMGHRIRECRKQKNLSQPELAESIGVSDNTISNMETGSHNIKLENIEKLADFFNVSLDYLVRGDEQVTLDDVFVKRYLKLSLDEKKKMLSVLDIFYPESA